MRLLRSIAAPVTGIVVLLVVWETVVRVFDIRRFVLLAPSKIVAELARDPGAYWANTLVTARHMLIGLAISLAVVAGRRFDHGGVEVRRRGGATDLRGHPRDPVGGLHRPRS